MDLDREGQEEFGEWAGAKAEHSGGGYVSVNSRVLIVQRRVRDALCNDLAPGEISQEA